MEYVRVYNAFGEKTTALVERNEAHRHGICHRVFHLWILNSQNELLLQQRSAEKDAGAGLWYVSVAGHIGAAESIESAMLREAKEELGLDIAPLADSVEYLFTFKERMVEDGGAYQDNEFFDVFVLRADFSPKQMTLQTDEVQAVKYIAYDDFKEMALRRDPSLWQHKTGYKLLMTALDDSIKG